MRGRNPPPVLELAEHDLDRVVTFVPALVVPYGRLPFLPARAAWAYLIVVQGLPEPVGIVATISEQPLHVGQPAEQRSRLNVVAEGAGGQEQIDGAALAIANGVQLRVPFLGRNGPPDRLLLPQTLWFGQSGVHAPFFNAQAGRRALGLQRGSVDHHSCLLIVLGGQTRHDLGEDALIAPSFPTVVKYLVGAVLPWGAAPPQPVAINEDNAT